MKKAITIIVGVILIVITYFIYFSEKAQQKRNEQEIYPCECCIKYDSVDTKEQNLDNQLNIETNY
jgi:hypothetical protein